MESFPLGKVTFATSVISASLATTASFATMKVLTASVVLDTPGPPGPNGSTFSVVGPRGPQGPPGPPGPSGLGVFLLSSTLGTCCNRLNAPFGWYAANPPQDPSTFSVCNTDVFPNNLGTRLYTPTGTGPPLGVGYQLYINEPCTFPLSGYPAIINFGAGENIYYLIDVNGVVTETGTCSGTAL